MKLKLLSIALLLAVVPAFAADIDGNWGGSLDTPNGPMAVSFTFKSEGSTLTGSTLGPEGKPVALKNGKVEGNKLTFTIDFETPQGPMSFNYTGEFSPTDLKLQTSVMDQPLIFLLKKVP